MIALQAPHLKEACRGHQRTIVIIYGIAQHIIIGIYLTAGFNQLYFIGKTTLAEHTYSLVGSGLGATERQVEINNLLHTLADFLHILIRQGLVVFLFKVAVVAV